MSGRGWKLFALAAAAVIAGYQLIPDDRWWVTGWQLGVGYGGVAAILIGVRRLPVRDRLPWWCFAFGVFANSTGILVSTYVEVVYAWVDLPTPSDWFFLLLYPSCALGLALLIRRREPTRNWMATVDATTITTGLGLLAWVYVIEPATEGGEISMLGRTVQVLYPIGDLLLLAMMTRLLRGGGTRGAPFWWLSGSLAAFLFGDIAWVVIGNLGEVGGMVEDVQWVSRSIDSVFLIAYVLFGVAALHSSARDVARADSPRPPRLGGVQLALLTLASLIAPGLLAVQLHSGRVTDGPAIVVGCAALFLLVVSRMAQLLREVERQARQVRELARRDDLTGLPNRRAWGDELPRSLEHARRDGTPVTVAMLDLDRFKQFNDTYGHPAGDQLLKAATASWHSALRTVDTLARYGGEEFIVLLPGADADSARVAVQRALDVTPLGQTFSAGIAVWDGMETSDELIQRADVALYRAKAAGRNRIETATGDRPVSAVPVP